LMPHVVVSPYLRLDPSAKALGVFRPKRDPDPEPPGRHVNVWLEDADPPMEVGTKYNLGVDIAATHDGSLVSRPFREPDWGDRQSLPIVLVLTADHAEIRPRYHPAVLPRIGDLEPVIFAVRTLAPGPVHFNLTVTTEREWDVLESVSFVIDAVSALEMATP
jgi:hypothetical protein